jgi:DNA-binding response OmpR family regulator
MAKILVIGSNPMERDFLALMTEFGGHCCATASFLEEAVGLLRNDPVELVITGTNLLDADLAYVVKTLKQTDPNVAVMILSDSGEILKGADAGLTIPYSPAGLLMSIGNVLDNFYSDSSGCEIAQEVLQ